MGRSALYALYPSITTDMFSYRLSAGVFDVQLAVRIPPHEQGSFPPIDQLIILVDNQVDVTIESMSDLSGLIDITSTEEALAMCRLTSDGFFAGATPSFRDWLGYELTETGSLLGHEGKLPPDVLERYDVSPASIRPVDHRWRIEKYVLSPHGLDDWELLKVVESISHDGNYELISMDSLYRGPIPTVPRQIRM